MSSRLANSIAAVAASTASLLGPATMRAIARVNKRLTNPIVLRWAARLPYVAVIEHNGRKSGTSYRTPVMAFAEDGKLSVVLNYGTESDWVRNVQAAGSAGVVHRGRHYQLTDPSIVAVDSKDLPAAVRAIRASARRALQGTLGRP